MFEIPGIDWLAECRFDPLDSSVDEIEKRVVDIEEWRTKICLGAETLITKASRCLNTLSGSRGS